jgi:ankyrin repeat protein
LPNRAALAGHKEVAELLIDNGADVDVKTPSQNTPLDRAIIYNHPETADLLRKHGGKTGDELKAEGK